MKFAGAATGQIEIVAGPLTGISKSAEVAAKTLVLGKTKLRGRGKGSRKIKVPLNPQGRKDLSQHHALHTHVVISFKDKGRTLRSETPVTVKAAAHHH